MRMKDGLNLIAAILLMAISAPGDRGPSMPRGPRGERPCRRNRQPDPRSCANSQAAKKRGPYKPRQPPGDFKLDLPVSLS